jgi:hypothetical protein
MGGFEMDDKARLFKELKSIDGLAFMRPERIAECVAETIASLGLADANIPLLLNGVSRFKRDVKHTLFEKPKQVYSQRGTTKKKEFDTIVTKVKEYIQSAEQCDTTPSGVETPREQAPMVQPPPPVRKTVATVIRHAAREAPVDRFTKWSRTDMGSEICKIAAKHTYEVMKEWPAFVEDSILDVVTWAAWWPHIRHIFHKPQKYWDSENNKSRFRNNNQWLEWIDETVQNLALEGVPVQLIPDAKWVPDAFKNFASKVSGQHPPDCVPRQECTVKSEIEVGHE